MQATETADNAFVYTVHRVLTPRRRTLHCQALNHVRGKVRETRPSCGQGPGVTTQCTMLRKR